MSNKKPPMDPETVLVTLDQVSQTIEVLTSVVGRLQKYVQTHMPQQPQDELPFAEDRYLYEKKSIH